MAHLTSRLQKSPTGIPGLDQITGGGLPSGRPTLGSDLDTLETLFAGLPNPLILPAELRRLLREYPFFIDRRHDEPARQRAAFQAQIAALHRELEAREADSRALLERRQARGARAVEERLAMAGSRRADGPPDPARP